MKMLEIRYRFLKRMLQHEIAVFLKEKDSKKKFYGHKVQEKDTEGWPARCSTFSKMKVIAEQY